MMNELCIQQHRVADIIHSSSLASQPVFIKKEEKPAGSRD